MERSKRRLRPRRDSGLPSKRDTPLRTTLSRRGKYKRLWPIKKYETLPEEFEPTLIPCQPLWTDIRLGHCKTVLHLSQPSCTEDTRKKATSLPTQADETSCNRTSPAGPATFPVTSVQKTFKDGEVANREAEQNSPVSPESSTYSCIEPDTTFNSDEDDEDACRSGVSGTSSSLSSPEIFRNENAVETLTFRDKEDLNIKNSTLLDVSHAKSIHLHHPPNLSNIADISVIPSEKNNEIIRCVKPEPETETQTDSLKSDEVPKWISPPNLINRKRILCKKKVWFKSPLISETFQPTCLPSTRLSIPNTSELSRVSGLPEQIKPDLSRAGEGSIKDDSSPLLGTLKRHVNCKAKFFDFIDGNDRDEFFQKMKERCVKLTSFSLFSAASTKHTAPSALKHLKPKYCM